MKSEPIAKAVSLTADGIGGVTNLYMFVCYARHSKHKDTHTWIESVYCIQHVEIFTIKFFLRIRCVKHLFFGPPMKISTRENLKTWKLSLRTLALGEKYRKSLRVCGYQV